MGRNRVQGSAGAAHGRAGGDGRGGGTAQRRHQHGDSAGRRAAGIGAGRRGAGNGVRASAGRRTAGISGGISSEQLPARRRAACGRVGAGTESGSAPVQGARGRNRRRRRPSRGAYPWQWRRRARRLPWRILAGRGSDLRPLPEARHFVHVANITIEGTRAFHVCGHPLLQCCCPRR